MTNTEKDRLLSLGQCRTRDLLVEHSLACLQEICNASAFYVETDKKGFFRIDAARPEFRPIIAERLPRYGAELSQEPFLKHYNKHLLGPVKHQEVQDDTKFVTSVLFNEWYYRFDHGRWASAIPVENTPDRICGFALIRPEEDPDFSPAEMKEQVLIQLLAIQSFSTVDARSAKYATGGEKGL